MDNYFEASSIGDSYQPVQLEEVRQPVSFFAIFFLAPFIIGAIAVSGLVGANYAIIGLGVICAVGYLISSIRTGFVFPKEILLFWAYLAWSMLGIFVSEMPILFYQKLFTLVQFSFMILIVAYFSGNIRNVKVLFWAVLIGAAIIAISAYVSGEYQRTESGTVATERAAGLALNSNSFALTLVYAGAILLFFFRTWRSWILKGGVIAVLLIMARLVIASGSRKGFIGFFLLLLSWFILSYRKEIFRRPLAFIVAAIAIGGVASFLYLTALGTNIERRMELARTGRGGSVSTRKMMANEGLGMIKSSPLVGVGLDHFRLRSRSGLYSHSNYIEVTTGSGIPGGILYYSVFLVLLLRLRRLGKLPIEPEAMELVNTAKAFLFVLLVIDIAAVTYSSKMNWIIMAIFIGWSFQMERRLKAEYTEELMYTETEEAEMEPAEIYSY